MQDSSSEHAQAESEVPPTTLLRNMVLGMWPSAQKGWGSESAGSVDRLPQQSPLPVAARAARIFRLNRVRTPTLLRARGFRTHR